MPTDPNPQETRPGWWCTLAGDYYYIWGTVLDIDDLKRRVIFVPASGPGASKVVSREVNLFRDFIEREGLAWVESGPRTLPPDFPTNLYVNRLA